MIVENPVLLFFNMAPDKEAAALRIASQMHIACRHMERSDMDTPLGSLAGAKNWFSPAAVPAGASDYSQEVMIICGVPDNKFDRLLSRLRAGGVNVPLKAILTETNAMWTAGQITAEIKAERDSILQRLQK